MTFIACVPSSSSRSAVRSIRVVAVPTLARRLASTTSPTPTADADAALAPLPSPTSSASRVPARAARSSTTTPASTTSDTDRPTHFLITLRRSTIGLPKIYAETLRTLGLFGRNRQSVLHPFSPETGGKILRVKELVSVQNVTEERGRVLMQRRKPEGAGLEITGRAYGGGRGGVRQ